jgi:hypothetical protein
LAGLVYQECAVRLLAIRSAVIHVVVLIVAPLLVRIEVPISVRDVAAIPAVIPARDARSADFHEELREESHAVVLSPAPVVRCVARVYWQEPVANQTDHGRGLAVAEAQAV